MRGALKKQCNRRRSGQAKTDYPVQFESSAEIKNLHAQAEGEIRAAEKQLQRGVPQLAQSELFYEKRNH